MNRRHTVVAALIASGALTLATVATTAGAQSAPHVVSTNPAPHIPPAEPEQSNRPATANPVVASQLARAFAVSRHQAATTLQALHAAAVNEQQTALSQAQGAVQSSEWACIRVAESGGNYSDTSGAYGILVSSWNAFASVWEPYGNFAVPGEAPAAVQDLVAYHLYQVGGGFGGWHDRCTGG